VAASGLLSTEMTGGDQNGGGGLEGGAMGIGSNASDGGRRSSGKGSLIRMLASGLTLFVLAPAGVRAQESVSEADCEAAIQTTADDYQSGRTPDPETEQLARDCTTPVSEGPIGETKVTTTKSGLRGTSCKTIHVGYGYTNGFGQLITALFGHLNWCYNGKKVQSGSFWTTEEHCCWWFWDGIVKANNQGCFGGCEYVYRYRLGSWIFNPPWPQTTTRAQIWVAMAGDKNGNWWKNAGD
jgi:hypothetical protein